MSISAYRLICHKIQKTKQNNRVKVDSGHSVLESNGSRTNHVCKTGVFVKMAETRKEVIYTLKERIHVCHSQALAESLESLS